MGRSHRIARLNFRKCDGVYADPVEMVVDYVLGDSHGESDVQWVLRKLERWENGSSFTSNSYVTKGPDVEDTATSRLTLGPDVIQNEQSNYCMQGRYRTVEDAPMDCNSETDNNFVFNGVNLPKLKSEEINCIMRKLTRDRINLLLQGFYEDLFEELSKYGKIESLSICDNLADHMVGNVYVQFREEEHAANAIKNLTGRFYAGRPIIVDFSPVTDFREATCRQYDENTCNRGGYCNFMHLKKISRELRRQLFGRSRRRRSHSRSRSRSPRRRRSSHEERPHSGRSYSRRYDDRDSYHEGRSRRRSTSPDRQRGRSRSPGGRRYRSPVREGSEERRAKIEQWNREREQQENSNYIDKDAANDKNENGNNVYVQNDVDHYQQHQE